MDRDNILDITEVMDESQNIHRRFHPRDDSGWVPHGRYTALRENGQIHLEITYRSGVVHGSYVDFWPNGKVACEGQFQDGKQDGLWHFYNKDGSVREIIHFTQDKEVDSSQYFYNENGTLCEIIKSNEFKQDKGVDAS